MFGRTWAQRAAICRYVTAMNTNKFTCCACRAPTGPTTAGPTFADLKLGWRDIYFPFGATRPRARQHGDARMKIIS